MKTEEPEVLQEEEEEDGVPRTRGSKAASSSKKRQSRYKDAFDDDDTYFDRLADGKTDNGDKGANEMGHEHQLKQASKHCPFLYMLELKVRSEKGQ